MENLSNLTDEQLAEEILNVERNISIYENQQLAIKILN